MTHPSQDKNPAAQPPPASNRGGKTQKLAQALRRNLLRRKASVQVPQSAEDS